MTPLALTLPRPLGALVANGQHAGSEDGRPYHFATKAAALEVGQLLLLHTSAGPGCQEAHRRAGALGYGPQSKGVFCGAARVASAVLVKGVWHVELGDCASISGVVPDREHRQHQGDHALWVPSAAEVQTVLRLLPRGWASREAA